MSTYYFSTTTSADFSEAEEKVRRALKQHGFGVLTEIDIQATLKKKLDVPFGAYKILGACNPPLAHEALLSEDKIGTMLPCNVIVRDAGNGQVEIAAVDPVASMSAIENPALASIATEVSSKLKEVINSIHDKEPV